MTDAGGVANVVWFETWTGDVDGAQRRYGGTRVRLWTDRPPFAGSRG